MPIKWIIIIAIVLLIYWWSKQKKKPYSNPLVDNLTSARVVVLLANGTRSNETVGFDPAGSGKMPGTNKPCRIFMIDTEYLETWARNTHHTAFSGLDTSTLRLSGGGREMDMSQFEWSSQYEAGRSVVWLYIRAK